MLAIHTRLPTRYPHFRFPLQEVEWILHTIWNICQPKRIDGQHQVFRSAPEDLGRIGTSPGQPGIKLQYLDQAEPAGVRRWNGLKDRSVDIKRAVAPLWFRRQFDPGDSRSQRHDP